MPHLFCAKFILPIDGPPLEDGALLVRDGRILALGRRHEIESMVPVADLRCIDFGDSVLLPPFVNAHTHLELTDYPDWCKAWRDRPIGAGFVDWIQHLIRLKSRLPRESFAASIRNGIRACLRTGCAAVGDILSSHHARSAYRQSPLQGQIYFELLGHDPDAARDQLEALSDKFAEAPFGRLAAGISPHAPYTLSPAVMDLVLAQARRRQWPVSLHLAESPEEVEFLVDASGPIAERLYPFVGWQKRVPQARGERPVPYLLGRSALPDRLLLAHGVQVNDEEVAQVKASGASLVLCPRSNDRLGVGQAPVAAYRTAGVPLALGTDSRASVPSLSLWDEVAFAREWFGATLTGAEWLEIASRGGARALDLGDRLGTLAAERPASFQVVAAPPGGSAENLAERLCATAAEAEVRALYVDGENVLPSA